MEKDEFWDRLHAVNAGMLDATDGVRSVPMSHHTDRDRNTLWFITAQGTDIVDAVHEGPQDATYIVCDGSKGVYADLRGTLTMSDDKAKLDEIWSVVADAWFEDGKDDPDVRLLAFHIDAGEAWLTPTSGIAFMLGIARAQLLGTPPDIGSHLVL